MSKRTVIKNPSHEHQQTNTTTQITAIFVSLFLSLLLLVLSLVLFPSMKMSLMDTRRCRCCFFSFMFVSRFSLALSLSLSPSLSLVVPLALPLVENGVLDVALAVADAALDPVGPQILRLLLRDGLAILVYVSVIVHVEHKLLAHLLLLDRRVSRKLKVQFLVVPFPGRPKRTHRAQLVHRAVRVVLTIAHVAINPGALANENPHRRRRLAIHRNPPQPAQHQVLRTVRRARRDGQDLVQILFAERRQRLVHQLRAHALQLFLMQLQHIIVLLQLIVILRKPVSLVNAHALPAILPRSLVIILPFILIQIAVLLHQPAFVLQPEPQIRVVVIIHLIHTNPVRHALRHAHLILLLLLHHRALKPLISLLLRLRRAQHTYRHVQRRRRLPHRHSKIRHRDGRRGSLNLNPHHVLPGRPYHKTRAFDHLVLCGYQRRRVLQQQPILEPRHGVRNKARRVPHRVVRRVKARQSDRHESCSWQRRHGRHEPAKRLLAAPPARVRKVDVAEVVVCERASEC
mmetsp:Transcript_16762/g.36420  ORF Transcript_16762/g.36420 Transcript_16762/m.36420 type:complete len:515 (+) Transcript_16762:846-2390(+)